MAPEAVRERDLHRYYQAWKEAQTDTPGEYDPTAWGLTSGGYGYKPKSTRDRALTAFAQLGAFRLNARRATVSLIDSKHQYILTEATKTLSLISHTTDDTEDELWVGSSILSREESICDLVFSSTYTATDEKGNSYTADGLVVEDIRADERFKNCWLVNQGPVVHFYAGVPIKTKAGHRIGVYAILHDEPRSGLTIEEVKFLQDAAVAVMEHLEMTKDRDDRYKGERMVRGLADFIEGSCALGKEAAAAAAAVARPYQTKRAISNAASTRAKGSTKGATVLERQSDNLKNSDDEGPTPLPPTSPTTQNYESVMSGPRATKKIPHPAPSNPQCIFYRAADIIRKSTYADGVVFFRTNSASLPSPSMDAFGNANNSLDDSQSGTSGSDMHASSGATVTLSRVKRPNPSTSQRAKDSKSTELHDLQVCEVIGLSVSENAPGEDTLCVKEFAFSEKSMDRYIKKFPHGKFFSFTEHGSGVSSGDEKSEAEIVEILPNGPHRANDGHSKHNKGRKEKFIPIELLKVLPGIRTLIFLPLWDPSAERWIAGGFIWTSQSGCLMSPDNELPYLKAFGNSITSEFARMNAMIADRAKASFIASVSHELRSPLHGILGSAEFLSDTAANSYQAGLISSIETCGRTLLDTIDHVLDYAKINKLNRGTTSSRRIDQNNRRGDESSIMGPSADVDLNSLVEEVCEAACTGHAFRERRTGDACPPGIDAAKGTESHHDHNHNQVSVSLKISPRLHCLVRTQPGAIRRIVMNLLGNSLKYTTTGFIAVSMEAHHAPDDHSKAHVVLTIEDSGRGMSLEYQRTRMFSPFSQEDPFSDGTGLGLSIVRQIVDSLKGCIEIRSTRNVGTTAQVSLILPVAGNPEEGIEPSHVTEARNLSIGKMICLRQDISGKSKHLECLGRSLSLNAVEWFDLDVLKVSDQDDIDADVNIFPDASVLLRLAKLQFPRPTIIICKNQAEEVALQTRVKGSRACFSNMQLVSQPLGPQKLAATLSHIFAGKPKHEAPVEGNHGHTGPLNMAAEHYHPHPPLRSFSDKSHGPTVDLLRIAAGAPVPTISARPIPIRLKDSSQKENGSKTESQPQILLVDDNKINLQLLVMFMKKIAFPYKEASDGLQAFEAFKSASSSSSSSPTILTPSTSNSSTSTDPKHPLSTSVLPESNSSHSNEGFSYVLMDISMPIMDGLESTRKIREFERENELKRSVIIALTGLSSAEAQRDALDAGVDYYLPKPVRFADLKRLLGIP